MCLQVSKFGMRWQPNPSTIHSLFLITITMLHRIQNAHIYDPADRGVCHLLVAAGRVVYLGSEMPELSQNLLASDTDLEGLRLIPGLVDGHAHTNGGGGEAGFKTRVPPVPLSDFTRAGVTTVVGLLGTDDLTRGTSALVARTRALREEGISAWCYTGGYHLPLTTLTGSARSDIVHIDCILGVGELALSDHRSSQPGTAELSRVASEAHVAGLMTGKAGIVHLHLGDGDRGLALVRQVLDKTELPPRVFNPTHCNRRKALFEEACELSERGSWIDLTAFPVGPDEDAWSAADGLQRYLEKGHPPEQITISSDGGGCLPEFDHQGQLLKMDYGRLMALPETLAELLAAGLTLDSILPPLSLNPARLLRLHDKGWLGPGSAADLVVLDDDHSVRDVMALGVWHVRAGQVVIRGTFEPVAKERES